MRESIPYFSLSKINDPSEKSKDAGLSNQDKVAAECLKKCVRKSWIPKIDRKMLDDIIKLVPRASKHSNTVSVLLQEVTRDFEQCLRKGALNLTLNSNEEKWSSALSFESKDGKDDGNPSGETKEVSRAAYFKDFKKNRQKILLNLHILHPCLRMTLNVCKHYFNDLTLADFDSFGGKSIDLDSFCGNIISESEKTEEMIINDWYPKIISIFSENPKITGERLTRFYNCVSSLLSLQLRGLLMKSISKYVSIFKDSRKIPRIEMELVLSDQGICFQPSVNEVINMFVSVIYEMNKLLREVPTVDSWFSNGTSTFVQVALNEDFINQEVQSLKCAVMTWIDEPKDHYRALIDKFQFLIDGTSRTKITDFINKKPKFEEICDEYRAYKVFVDQTQEISSLEYFTLFRLDCENLRRSLGGAARKLSNLLLKNVVDTYRQENLRICKSFEEIEKVALQSPKSTKEMIEFGEFMLNVKNKKMLDLTEEIEISKKHLLYLIDVHVFTSEDISLNTLTLGWLTQIKPVFEQNTEIIEDCKAKFEDNLQKKSEWTIREIEKLSSRVHELEELGEIFNIQQYNYEVRQIQNKLKKLDETIKWINQEEALFKFPQTTYSEVGNMNTNIEPYARLFTTVLKWQKAEKKCTDGAFLDLNANQIENNIIDFMKEMSQLQKLFKLKFKQQALDGDSKYAKMNLEDSNPENLPPPLKICALTIIQIKGFQTNIPLITCLCNPGLRKRHWNKMSLIIGFDITPNSGSSLRKMLCLNLEKHMSELDKISMTATREHGLELTIAEMKDEWESKNFEFTTDEWGHKVLSNFESVQEVIDNHLSKTQAIKGSPYFKPFESEVRTWERELRTVHESLLSWEIVQKKWISLESFFSKESVKNQLPSESELFTKVDEFWEFVLKSVNQATDVMTALNIESLIEALNECKSLLAQIDLGLNSYIDMKRSLFPRLFFLSVEEVIRLVTETQNPIHGIRRVVNIIFGGIASIEVSDQEIVAIRSPREERLSIKPIGILGYSGSIEQILIELEKRMVATLRDQILSVKKELNPLSDESIKKYCFQALEVGLRILWTEDCLEGIKGGRNALNELKSKFLTERERLVCSFGNIRSDIVASLLLQNIYFVDSITNLVEYDILTEEDFVWERKPRATIINENVMIDVFPSRFLYDYEYRGLFSKVFWTQEFETAMLSVFMLYSERITHLVRGTHGSGKTELIREACSLLGKNLQIWNMPIPLDRLRALLKGICASGAWLLLRDLDTICPQNFSKEILPIVRRIESSLQNESEFVHTSKDSYKLKSSSYVCFSSKVEGSHQYLDFLRPITLLKPRLKELLKANIISRGLSENECGSIIREVIRSKELFSGLERIKFQFGYPDIDRLLRTAFDLHSRRSLSPVDAFRRAEYLHWKGRLGIEDGTFLLEGYYRDNPSIKGPFEDLIDEISPIQSYFEKLNLSIDERQIESVRQILYNLRVNKFVILCGPPVSGKSTLIQISEMYENEESKGSLDVFRVMPNAYNNSELYGAVGHREWKDGLLNSFLAKDSKKIKWVVMDGSIRSYWSEKIDSLLESDYGQKMILDSGNRLILPKEVKFIFETTSIATASPRFISSCSLVLACSKELDWRLLLQKWINFSEAKQNWKEGYEDSIRDMVEWLIPCVLRFISENIRTVVPFIPLHAVRCFLSSFSILLNEAIPNLKEKKYLRMWIQAGIIVALIWSTGSTLDLDERAKFDVFLRDLLSGKNLKHPLPPALNNKFDAMPPSEGTVYDFIFDFKARGQWKYWNDVSKNLSAEESLTYYEESPVVHSVDTIRFAHFYNINVKRNLPTLLVGAPGCGKTSTVGATLMGLKDSVSFYKYNCLSSSKTENLQTWLMKHLEKKKYNTYGPAKSKGVLLLDNIDIPKCKNESIFQEFASQLFELNSWYHLPLGTDVQLCDMNYVAIMSTSHKPESDGASLDDKRYYSRMSTLFNPEQSEDVLVRIFSNAMNVTFKKIGFPPEISGVIPALIHSTLSIFYACKRALITENVERILHGGFVNMRDIARVLEGCALLPKENADNKKLFTRLWVHESLRVFYDRLVTDKGKDMIYNVLRDCVKNQFRENFDSGFEHLGKVNGVVTQENLKNLMFGVYLSENTKSRQYCEVTEIEQFEKRIQSKLKAFNSAKDDYEDPINIFPLKRLRRRIVKLLEN